jgi:hypothetical protein
MVPGLIEPGGSGIKDKAHGNNQTGSVGHSCLFFRSKGSRPAHFKELRTGDARPLRLTARDSAGTASPLAVPLAFARGHRVPHSVTS